MTRANWNPGEYLYIDKTLYQYEGRSKNNLMLNLKRYEDGIPMSFPEAEIVRKIFAERDSTYRTDPPANDVEPEAKDYRNVALALLPGSIPAQTQRWRTYVIGWKASELETKTGPKLLPIVAAVAEELNDPKPPSLATFERWIKRAHPGGVYDISVVRPKFECRGRASTLDPRVFNIMKFEAYRLTFCDNPRSAVAIREQINGRLQIEYPKQELRIGESTVRRFLMTFSKHKKMMTQRGFVEARKLLPFGEAPMAKRILQVVMVDHTVLDIFIRSPCRKYVLGRPIITALIDEFSGMVIGFFISFKDASAYSVNMAIRNAILDKSYIKEENPNIENDWPALGTFAILRCDNGPEFHGNDLKQALTEIGAVVQWCPAYQPWYKAAIENFFSILQPQLRFVPGGVYPRDEPLGRGDYDPEEDSVMNYDDLVKYIRTFIIDRLNILPYTDDGRSRLDLWNESAKLYPPELPRNVHVLDALFARTADAKLERNGLRVMGLRYSGPSKEFDELFDAGWEGKKLTVKIDDADISYIWVPHPTRKYIKVYCTSRRLTAGLTYDMWECIKERTKEQSEIRVRPKVRAAERTRVELEDQIEQAKRKTVMAKRIPRAFLDSGQKRREQQEQKAVQAAVDRLMTPKPMSKSEPAPPVAPAPDLSFEEKLRQHRAERGITPKETP